MKSFISIHGENRQIPLGRVEQQERKELESGSG